MKKLTILIIILGLSLILPGNAVVSDLNSSVIMTPTGTLLPTTNYTLYVYVANSTHGISGANVTFTVSSGKLISSPQAGGLVSLSTLEAISNSSGYVKIVWESPQTDFSIPTINVQLLADIQYPAESLSKSLSKTISVGSPTIDSIAQITQNLTKPVLSNQSVVIKTTVKNNLGLPTPNTQVSLTLPIGNFTSNSQGLTDTNGEFIVSWRAPILSTANPSQIANLTILAQISPSVNNSKIFLINVTLGKAADIVIQSSLPQFTKEGTVQPITITVLNNQTLQQGAEISISTTRGYFKNQTGSYVLTDATGISNSTGQLTVYWKAPILDNNLNVTNDFSLLLNLGTIQVTSDFNTTIYPVLKSFKVKWLSSTAGFSQNKTIPVSLQLLDSVSSLPVANANVQLSSEYGVWNVSNSDVVSLTSDSQGTITGYIDVSNVKFEFQFQNLTVIYSASSSKYRPIQGNQSLSIERSRPNLGFKIILDSKNATVGQSIGILIKVDLKGNPVQDVTLELSTTTGYFVNSTSGVPSNFRGRTDTAGLLKVVWKTDNINQTDFNLTNYIHIKAYFQSYTYDLGSYKINLYESTTSATTNILPNSSPTAGSNSLIIGSIATALLVAAGGTIIVIKKYN